MFKTSPLIALLSLGITFSASAQGTFLDPFAEQTTGSTAYNYWEFHSYWYSIGGEHQNADFGSFPGSGPWGQSATSLEGTPGHDAALRKDAGNLFIGGTLYSGGLSETPGAYGADASFVVDSALEGVRTIVLQWKVTTGLLTEILDGPTLFVDGSSVGLSAGLTQILSVVEEDPVWRNDQWYDNFTTVYLYQWSLDESVSSFEIGFTMEQHAQMHEAQLDQSTVFYPIPEPSTWMLLGAGLAGAAFLRHRRR